MALGIVFTCLTIILVAETNSMLLEPRVRCAPTEVASGTCHFCVCSTDGEFHCRPRRCRNHTDAFDAKLRSECEPNRTYREESLICTCSQTGSWKSANCRGHFYRIPPKPYHPAQRLRTKVPCKPNSLYLLDCNVCECGSSGLIEFSSCTQRRCKRGRKSDFCINGDILRTNNELCSCSDINLYIDRLCFKVSEKPIQKIERTDLETIIDIGKSWTRTNNMDSKYTCVPHTVITVDCNKCVCTENGLLACTDKYCIPFNNFALRTKEQNSFYSLPQLSSRDSSCKPNMKYRHKCNTCVCSLKGKPSCTTMICLDEFLLDNKMLETTMLEHHEALDEVESKEQAFL